MKDSGCTRGSTSEFLPLRKPGFQSGAKIRFDCDYTSPKVKTMDSFGTMFFEIISTIEKWYDLIRKYSILIRLNNEYANQGLGQFLWTIFFIFENRIKFWIILFLVTHLTGQLSIFQFGAKIRFGCDYTSPRLQTWIRLVQYFLRLKSSIPRHKAL